MTNLEKYQRSILATLLANPKLFDGLADVCDCIRWHEPYAGIYRAMKSGTMSVYMLAEHAEVKIKGAADEFLIELMRSHRETEMAISHLIGYCADHTNADYVRGKLVDLMNGNGDLNSIASELNIITGEISTLYRASTYDMAQMNEIQMKAIEANQAGNFVSLKCGSQGLQFNLMGWHPGDLCVFGGNSSSGKTAFVLTVMRWAAEANSTSVALISYELTVRQLHARLLGAVSEVQPRNILYTQLDSIEMQRVHKGMGVLEKIDIILEKPGDSDIETLVSKLRVLAANGTKLIAIDYLQLVRDRRIKDKYERVGSNARRLKNVAMELDICIIVLSQLNRENMKSPDKRPTIASLRDSGEIEEAADIIGLLYRPDYFLKPGEDIDPELRGKCEVHFAKGRSTGTGMYVMEYEKEYTRFKDPADSFPVEHAIKSLSPSTEFDKAPVKNFYEVDRDKDEDLPF